VATDQKASLIETDTEQIDAVIENELPSYRAISAIAILAIVCGGLSIFTFADPIFYVFSVLAIGLGFWAHRSIRRYPDMLTGRGLANAGIALGLVFGLASGTISTVQYLVRSRQAEKFARKYATLLSSSNMGDVLMYTTHPDTVKDKTSAQVLKEYEATQANERRRIEQTLGPLAQMHALRRRLTGSKDQVVRFVKLEGVGEESGHGLEVQLYALALLEIHGPATEQFPEPRQFALAILKARPKGRQYEWWADSVRFPYEPKTFVPPESPVSDGHDHPH
jgi:hypothetical protein